MIEFQDIEREFHELEKNDEWEENFRFNYSMGDSGIENTLDNAKHSSNEKYNRYRNILPYDQSRIKLKECAETDYINANLVENKYINRKYILSQGPLRNTCEHFWQMVWEQNTKGIVMLNRLFEKGMPKCEMYFPNLDEDNSEMTLTFGKFKLNYISEQPGIDYSIRVIECENLEQKEVREIYHFHFTNWPDFGEPETSTSFLKFLNECHRRNIFDSDIYGPPVVHCSAGVGRSGTFILVDLILELLKLNDNKIPCSIPKLLDELRSYRMGLVQTHTQYKFAFKAIINGVKQTRNGSSSQAIDHEDIVFGDQLNVSDDSDEESDEDEDSDDEFYENDVTKKPSNHRRPDTAGSHMKKKFNASKKNRNRISNLRSMQEKNRITNEEITNAVEASNGFETAKSMDLRLNLDFLKDNTEPNRPALKITEEDSDLKDEESEDNDENPFATDRDVQTVKVNQIRKPLEQTLKEQSKFTDPTENNSYIYQRKVSQSNDENPNLSTSGQTKKLSAKDQRIAEKIKEIKQKQKSQESSQKLMEQFKPLFIGGGLLIGGFLIFEICKKNFFH